MRKGCRCFRDGGREIVNNNSNIDNMNKKLFISNEKIDIVLDYSNGIVVEKWALKKMSVDENIPQKDWEAFIIKIDGKTYPSSLFTVTEVEKVRDETQELATIILEYQKMGIKTKICLLNDMKSTVNFIIQLAVDWEDDCPREVYMHIPFLANFHVQGSNNSTYLYPNNPFPKKNGTSIVQLHSTFRLPLCVFDNGGNDGFSIKFPLLTDLLEGSQNRNLDLRGIYSEGSLKNHDLRLRPGRILSDVVDLEINAEEEGWRGLFSRLRDEYKKAFNMQEYEREDLAWYNDTLLHHLTYVFGKEAYDYESNQLDIDRLLDQGDEFGGYDVIIIWHQYPRLGVDQRNQWNFYDDFPSGREGIKQIVDRAHKRGTKVFLPFKPWDVGQNESSDSVAMSIAALVRDTDIDGFFLDCMDSVPKSFRQFVDEIKPGVVFYSEGHPGQRSALEILTSSWDQYSNWEPMPESDLLRFMMPEHISPIIARWHVGDKKDMLIKRAIFNGTGIVIWQDIFGSWLPYSSEQKAIIKKWKTLWCANRHTFLCKRPIPLYPTMIKGLHCNMFPSDKGDEIIYVLYNENEKKVTGSLLINADPAIKNAIECWSGAETSIKFTDKGTEIISSVDGKQLTVIKASK